MSFRPEDRVSIFGALRPGRGQAVSRAVLATYSLDLVALLGLVLALGGDGEAEFESSPLGLVQALERVRGKLQVLHQQGRIIAPRAHRSVLPLLDRMVVAVPADERVGSWHPKLALVRYDGEDGAAQWRFWIGSRNLTGSSDLEAGLLLVSSRDRAARAVPDISSLAQDLLREACFSPEDIEELRKARWLAPPGVSVRTLFWRRPGGDRRFLDAPLLGRGEKACAVSPFVDRRGLAEVQRAGCAAVTLLTTARAASDCAPVRGIAFRTGSAPEPELEVSVAQQVDEQAGEFIDPPPGGVHAKLLAITKGERTALMLGSANLTERGLKGPNAEAVAVLDVRNPNLAETLHAFVRTGFELASVEPDEEAKAREQAQRELDRLVSALLEADFTLAYDEAGVTLGMPAAADAGLRRARFEAAPFLCPEAWVPLTAGARTVRLLHGPVGLSEQTSLVAFRATRLDDPSVQRSWVLALPVAGLDEERRDRALLARYVGPSRFRDWLRSLLDGVDGTLGQRWSDPRPAREPDNGSPLPELFTLETMLAAWARDPDVFERRVSGMMAMLASFREVFEALEDEVERRRGLADLDEVQPFLQALYDAIEEGA